MGNKKTNTTVSSKKQKSNPERKNDKINQRESFWNKSETPFFLRPQNIFLLLASVFGLCFVFLMPPFQVPDEASHMFRAYQLSRFHVKVEEQNNVFGNYRPPAPDNKVVGNYLPASFDSAQMQFWYLKFQPNNKVKKKAIIDACGIKLEPSKEKFIEMTAGNYSFVNYIPQILAMDIGRLLDLNVLPLFYLARVFALAFFYFVCMVFDKNTSFRKKYFFGFRIDPYDFNAGRVLFRRLRVEFVCFSGICIAASSYDTKAT